MPRFLLVERDCALFLPGSTSLVTSNPLLVSYEDGIAEVREFAIAHSASSSNRDFREE